MRRTSFLELKIRTPMRSMPVAVIVRLAAAWLLTDSGFADQEHSFRAGMELGRGVDTLSGDVRGVCVTRTPPSDVQGGQRVKLTIERIESKEELRKAMDLNAQASLSGVGDAKVDYFKSREFNRYSFYLLVSASVRNSQQVMDAGSVALTEEAEILLGAGQIERFRERCGDVFLNGQISGGEYFAIYEFKTSSSNEREKLDSEVKGSYGVFSASAAFKNSLERISEMATTNITVHRTGDDGSPISREADAILEYASNFPQVISHPEKAVIYRALVLDYRTLDLPGDAETFLETRPYEDEIAFLATRENEYDDAIHSILYVFDNPSQFEDLTTERQSALNGKLNDLRDARRRLQKRALGCFRREEASCLGPIDPELTNARLDDLLPKEREGRSATEEAQARCDERQIVPPREVQIAAVEVDGTEVRVVFKSERTPVSAFLMDQEKGFWTRPLAKQTTLERLDRGCEIVTFRGLQRSHSYCFGFAVRHGNRTEIGDNRSDHECLSIQ